MLKVRGPAIAATLQGKETMPVTFDVDLIRKDLRTMLEEAAALGEALSLCRGLDIAPARLIDIFADTSGGPNMLKVRGSAIAATLQGKETNPVTFDVDLIRKDLRTMLEEAAAIGLSLPLAARALDCYDAVAADGLGASDATMLPAPRFLSVGLAGSFVVTEI